MKDTLAIIRTSTERQEIESQRKELLEFIKKDGINVKQVQVIGEAGASAIKLDERYRRNLDKVYDLINAGNVKIVYAWSLDRIGRDEETLIKFKNFLIEHKVNLKTVNPTMTLLNPDGTVNNGMELAFSLYITLAKQEMQQKKARFKRAKERNRENGKYNGGSSVLFGYKVDEHGFIVPDPVESENLKLLFELYSTGKYSMKKLETEIRERGMRTKYTLNATHIARYLRNDVYCGRGNYPAIVPAGLFDKVQALMKENVTLLSREHTHSYFGTKMIICPECGHYFVANLRSYRCHQHTLGKCGNSLTISMPIVDGLLWHFAKMLELDAQLNRDKSDIEILKGQLEVLHQKERTLSVSSVETKIANTKRLYMDAMITREEFEQAMKRHNDADKDRKDRLLEVQEEIKGVKKEIERLEQPSGFWEEMASLGFKIESLRDEKKMRDIIHETIKKTDVTRTKHGFELVMSSYKDFQMKAEYWPRKKKLFINGIPEDVKKYKLDRSKLKTCNAK